ncbi:Protein of unknown function [Bacillus cereus]|nr:Protein of unknown function [Bacillus cereus]
MGVGVS